MSDVLDGLVAHELSASLGGRSVLQGIDLAIPHGQWTCIVGPNGAGKSTLLRAMAQLIPCTGDVRWLGQRPDTMTRQARARTLSWLGQSDVVDSDLRVRDVVMLGRLPRSEEHTSELQSH